MRKERDLTWMDDAPPIDDLPTEDIEPVNIDDSINIEPDRRGMRLASGTPIPADAAKLYDILENWFDEAYRRTKRTGREHAFYVDYLGNVIGIIEGSSRTVPLPRDISGIRSLLVHTHPLGDPTISPADINLFDSGINRFAGQYILTVGDQDQKIDAELSYFYIQRQSDIEETSITTPSDRARGIRASEEYLKDTIDILYESQIRFINAVSTAARMAEDLSNFIVQLEDDRVFGYDSITPTPER